MPTIALSNSAGTTFSPNTATPFSTSVPPGAPSQETGATSAGGATSTAVVGSPLAVYQSAPTQYGGNTIGRSFDTLDCDALQNLTGAVTGHGLYQDLTAFVAYLSARYAAAGAPASQVMLTPRALLVAIRDQINFVLANSPVG